MFENSSLFNSYYLREKLHPQFHTIQPKASFFPEIRFTKIILTNKLT